uniref:Putative secreted protein n=1 Tax=Xenopsylla cheopis TaxID=163159 RepID=A0A6M2DYQ1_XENCH
MGGHMASLAATNWPKPIVLVPCLSWSTASAVFTRGVLSQSINWELLETQYLSDGVYKEKLSKMVTIVDDAFLAGKRFVQNFSQSMSELKQDMQQHLENSSIREVDLKLSAIKDIDNEVNKQVNKVIKHLCDQPVKINSPLTLELINKITSDAKFELNSQEICELNKMNSSETTPPSFDQNAEENEKYRYEKIYECHALEKS